jgi:hypothetical protein
MKKQITRTLVGLVILLALAVTAYAQEARRVRVEVPFDFVAGQKHLPAGRYSVSRIQRDGEKALMIRSEEGQHTAIVLTNTADETPTRAELSFRRYEGERYFLASVSIPGTEDVREVRKSDGEKRLERELRAQSKNGSDAVKTIAVVGSVQ